MKRIKNLLIVVLALMVAFLIIFSNIKAQEAEKMNREAQVNLKLAAEM